MEFTDDKGEGGKETTTGFFQEPAGGVAKGKKHLVLWEGADWE